MKKHLLFLALSVLFTSTTFAMKVERIQLSTGDSITTQTQLQGYQLDSTGKVDQLLLKDGSIIAIEDVKSVLLKTDSGKKEISHSQELIRNQYSYMRNLGGDGSGGG